LSLEKWKREGSAFVYSFASQIQTFRSFISNYVDHIVHNACMRMTKKMVLQSMSDS